MCLRVLLKEFLKSQSKLVYCEFKIKASRSFLVEKTKFKHDNKKCILRALITEEYVYFKYMLKKINILIIRI